MARCGIGIKRKKRKSLVGTLGCLVQDSKGIEYILSNNHILANFNKAKKNKDKIFRKGRRKPIATLARWKPLSFNGPTNRIDAAIAKLTRPGLVKPEIKKIGRVHETMAATVGQCVHKYGHATGYTTGVIKHVGITPQKSVPTGDGRTMKFENQIVIISDSKKPFSKEGDSGSLVIDRVTNKVVGLVFATNKKHTYTIANPIDEVLAEFNVTFV